MTLRVKLALTLLIVSIPLVFAIESLRRGVVKRNIVEKLEDFVSLRFEDEDRIAFCERNSEFFGGPGWLREPFSWSRRRPLRLPVRLTGNSLWAYDIGFVSDNQFAPDFPSDLREMLRKSGTSAAIWGPESLPELPPSGRRSRGDRDRRDRRRRTPSSPRDPDARERPAEPNRVPLPKVHFAMFTSADDGPCAVVYVTGWVEQSEGDSNWWWIAYGLTGALVLVALLAAGPMVRRIRLLTDDVHHAADDAYATEVTVRGRDEIADLATAFNVAGKNVRQQIDRASEREAALREFVANTTHDVMIPLTVIQGHLSTIHARLPEDAAVKPEVVAAADEAHYLGSILQNLSAVSKLEGADYVIRNDEVRLDTLVERVVQRHKPIARARNIHVEHAVPAGDTTTRGDMTLIEQAVSNVVHNAVRYNEDGGHVAVLLDVDESTQTFSLRIIDDGPGISAEDLARLPERRFRGETARTRNPDGNGLGLHIARDVCEKHGFEFGLRASEYGGLEVEFGGKLEQRAS